MIEIKNLTKKYGKRTVIENMSLTVESGTICAFIGKNGSGKTTTIKSIVGLHNFENGEIYLDGLSIKDNPIECKKNFAYIPDEPHAYEFMTGNAYINFVADIYNVEKSVREEKIKTLSKMLDMEEALCSPISSYSHGMKQKIVIIAALVHSPKILILDEPFVGLDPSSAFKLKELMRNLASEGGTVFFSTHVLEVAEKLCDTVAIIDEGKIVKSGKMKDVIGDQSLEKLFLELENK